MLTEGGERDGVGGDGGTEARRGRVGGDGGEAGSGATVARRRRGRGGGDGGEAGSRETAARQRRRGIVEENWGRKQRRGNQAARGVR